MMIFAMVLIACDKKDSYYDPYYIDYKEGREYELIFYVSDIYQIGTPPNDYQSLTLISIDRRIAISGLSSNSLLAPTNLAKPDLEETNDLKLYQVADFRFTHMSMEEIEKNYTKTKDWRWVYGQIKDYKFPDGSVHQRIEIVSEI